MGLDLERVRQIAERVAGSSGLEVVANGIPSAAVDITVSQPVP